MELLAVPYISEDTVTKASLMCQYVIFHLSHYFTVIEAGRCKDALSYSFLIHLFPKDQNLSASIQRQDQRCCTTWQDEVAHHYKNIGKGSLITCLQGGVGFGSNSLSQKTTLVADLPANMDLRTSVKSLFFHFPYLHLFLCLCLFYFSSRWPLFLHLEVKIGNNLFFFSKKDCLTTCV